MSIASEVYNAAKTYTKDTVSPVVKNIWAQAGGQGLAREASSLGKMVSTMAKDDSILRSPNQRLAAINAAGDGKGMFHVNKSAFDANRSSAASKLGSSVGWDPRESLGSKLVQSVMDSNSPNILGKRIAAGALGVAAVGTGISTVNDFANGRTGRGVLGAGALTIGTAVALASPMAVARGLENRFVAQAVDRTIGMGGTVKGIINDMRNA